MVCDRTGNRLQPMGICGPQDVVRTGQPRRSWAGAKKKKWYEIIDSGDRDTVDEGEPGRRREGKKVTLVVNRSKVCLSAEICILRWSSKDDVKVALIWCALVDANRCIGAAYTRENTWLQTGLTCSPEFSQRETQIGNHDQPINCSYCVFFCCCYWCFGWWERAQQGLHRCSTQHDRVPGYLP